MGNSAYHKLVSIFEKFEHCHEVAYFHIDGDMTYSELFVSSIILCHKIHKILNSKIDDLPFPILIYGDKKKEYLIAYWACILSGHPLVPVEVDNSIQRIQQIKKSAKACLLLNTSDSKYINNFIDVPYLEIEITQQIDNISKDLVAIQTFTSSRLSQPFASNIMYIMYSSGTTGVPKGIQVSYLNMVDFIDWLELTFSVSGTVSGNIRYCFDVSLFELWLAWLNLKSISALDYREFFNTRKHLERFKQHQLSVWVSTPSIVRCFLSDRLFNGGTLPNLSKFVFCGEVLTKEIVELLWTRFPASEVTNTYGPTECTVAVTSITIENKHIEDKRPLPLGIPRFGTQLKLRNVFNQKGEIIISGHSVGPGYLNSPEKQNKQFIKDIEQNTINYCTGDIGSIEEGLLYFWGRSDRECKIQGYRIDLNELEVYLKKQHEISEAIVEPFYRKNMLQGINAFILGNHTPLSFSTLAINMLNHFPRFMIPKYWYTIKRETLNLNSKLDRKKVTEYALNNVRPFVFSNQVIK